MSSIIEMSLTVPPLNPWMFEDVPPETTLPELKEVLAFSDAWPSPLSGRVYCDAVADFPRDLSRLVDIGD